MHYVGYGVGLYQISGFVVLRVTRSKFDEKRFKMATMTRIVFLGINTTMQYVGYRVATPPPLYRIISFEVILVTRH